jgi:hypothetical protein
MKTRPYLVIALLYLLVGGGIVRPQTSSQGRIIILQVNQQTLPLPEILLEGTATIDVRGKVVGLDQQSTAASVVQILIHRLYDGQWRVVDGSTLIPSRANAVKPISTWLIQNVHFPTPDYGKGFEIVAVLVSRGSELPHGVLDYGTVRRLARAMTEPLHIRFSTLPPRAIDATGGCRIQIRTIQDIYGNTVPIKRDNEVPIEVGLQADVRGTANKRKQTYEYLVVQPANSDARWVMRRQGDLVRENWSETAVFGLPGMHTGEIFRMTGIISKRPIAPGRYSADRWMELKKNICAEFGEVLTRRRIGPGDLVIARVGDQEVKDQVIALSALESEVDGTIEDPQRELALTPPTEAVWILYKVSGGPEEWIAGDLAVPSADGFYWRVPALRFPRNGDYSVVAVSANVLLTRGQKICDSDWYQWVQNRQLRRLSKTVTVQVQ